MPQIFNDSLGEVLRCSGDIQPASMGCATANPGCATTSCGTGCGTGCGQCGGSGCHSCWNTGTALAGNTGLVQYNNGGCLDGIPFSYYSNGNLTLGNVSQVKLLGGGNTQILATDGTGNLYFTDSCCGELQPDMIFDVPVTGIGQSFTHPNIASFSNIANRGGGFANNYAEVFRNGVLVPSTEYVINGNVLTMNNNIFAGDKIIIAPTGANSAITDPGGLNGQIQFNNFGSFGGVPVATYDGNVMTIQFLSAGNTNITNVLNPVNPQDAATKAYVDSVATGLTVLSPVVAATTTSLAGTYNNGANGIGARITLSSPLTTLDGVTLNTGDRVLIKDQSIASENGIYFIDALKTTLTRVVDADIPAEIDKGTYVFVQGGTINGSASYVETADVSNIGNSSILFNQFAQAGRYTASNNVILVGSDFQLPVQANLSPGTYGNANLIPVITVNEFGVISNVSTVAVQMGNIANINLNGNSLTFLDGTGNWTTPNGLGTVTRVGTTINGGNVPQLGFSLDGGNITTTGDVNLVVPSALDLANSMGLGNVAYANFTGNPNQVLYGNGVWANAGTGTVTRVGTVGSGLGFSLTGGNITSAGDVILTVPSAPALTTALGYGNIVYSNYNGNGNTVLTGAGTWAPYTAGGGNATPGGSPTQLQFNANGTFGGVTGTGYDGSKLTLGSNTTVKITGGAGGQVLSTDGLGNLTWVNQTGGGGITVPGGSNTMLQFNNNGIFGGIPTVTWNGNVLSLGQNSAVSISGGGTGQVLTTDGAGNLSWTTVSGTVPAYPGNTQLFLNGNGQWTPAGSGSGIGTVTSVATAGAGLGFALSGGTITTAGTVTLTTPTAPQLTATLGYGNIVYTNYNGNGGTVLAGNGQWVSAGAGTVTQVGGNGSGLGFALSGTVTSTGNVTLQTPTVTGLRTTLNIGTVANLNLTGSTTTFLRADGTWVTPTGAGIGTVTSVGTAGSGLGFSLTGGTITSAGTVQLNVPSGPGLTAALGYGNIVYTNFNGASNNVLYGNGVWAPVAGGSAGAAGSNSQVQYNNNGALGADAGMTFNPTTDTLTLANAVSTGGIVDLRYGIETLQSTGATTGTQTIDVLTSSTLYGTAPLTGNVVVNVRGNSSTTLNSMLNLYQSIVVAYYVPVGVTGYTISNLTVDGVSAPISWAGGGAPGLVTNTTLVFTFQIVKISSTPTYKVFGTMSTY